LKTGGGTIGVFRHWGWASDFANPPAVDYIFVRALPAESSPVATVSRLFGTHL
jgi:hypothetical protein